MYVVSHRFEIFTLVSEFHENVDLVLGIKNTFELEGVIDSCASCFSFLNTSIPFFPKEKTENTTKSTKDGCDRSLFCGGIVRNGNRKGLAHE